MSLDQKSMYSFLFGFFFPVCLVLFGLWFFGFFLNIIDLEPDLGERSNAD